MKHVRSILLIPTLVLIGLTGCEKYLSEDELEVIEDNMARTIYTRNIERQAESVEEYFQDALQFYCDDIKQTTQKKIDERNATSALLGGNPFDMGELFGTSTNQIMARKYYDFVDYVNNKMEEMTDDVETIVDVIRKNPSVIETFYDGRSTISLEMFGNVEGLPSTITPTQFATYKDLEQNKANRSEWGRRLMGTARGPHYSPLAVLSGLVARIAHLKYPKPVYAVRKEFDESDGWEVGYDTSQAYFITFEETGDVLEYEYFPMDFSEAYINSENNKLKKD